jgi:glycosyltransferase involved in cell wall biosynthesis
MVSNLRYFGLVALESTACGAPIVAVYEGGICESVVLNEESGYYGCTESLFDVNEGDGLFEFPQGFEDEFEMMARMLTNRASYGD